MFKQMTRRLAAVRPREFRFTPPVARPTRLPVLIASGLVFWGGLLFYAFNLQRHESAIVAATLFSLRNDDRVRSIIGDGAHFKHGGWTWIHGTVNYLKGNVDICFAVRASKGDAQVSFKSKRDAAGEWHTLAYSLEHEGRVVNMMD
jgi:hypothetical protein